MLSRPSMIAIMLKDEGVRIIGDAERKEKNDVPSGRNTAD